MSPISDSGLELLEMSARPCLAVDDLPPQVESLSDVELMRACRSVGESDVWDEFVRRFNRFVCLAVVRAYGHCSGLRTGQLDPDVVADLVQDVYLKLYVRSRSTARAFRGECDAAVYVYIGRVAISVAVDAQRRRLARKRGRDLVSLETIVGRDEGEDITLGSILHSPEASPEQIALASVFRREVRDILAGLVRGRNASRDLRIAEAYLFEGTPLSEIAESMSALAPGAMKSSVRRTGAKLRAEIGRRERAAVLGHARV